VTAKGIKRAGFQEKKTALIFCSTIFYRTAIVSRIINNPLHQLSIFISQMQGSAGFNENNRLTENLGYRNKEAK
jgi:hypothetical protein